MITDINNEDRLVQGTFADHLHDVLGWESVFAHNEETFGPNGTLGRASEREVVLVRDLRAAVQRLNPDLPESAREQAVEKLTRVDFARSLFQHNKEFHDFIRNGVPVEWRDVGGQTRHARARVIDFRNGTAPDGTPNNRFLAVRELKIQGLRVPHYNRRADLVCFVNGLPLVLIELKAIYLNMRAGFDNNLTDYLSETSINHAFHHNAFLIVSNGDRARYGSVTSKWEHFAEWKRNDEKDKGSVEAEVLLIGMLAKERLLDLVENFILFDESRPGGVRKIVARNHQVLGVNLAVDSVMRQEELKLMYPPERRVIRYLTRQETAMVAEKSSEGTSKEEITTLTDTINEVPLVQRAHPDLGRLGVFWQTQGSGKSYSMVMFTGKVRRRVPGNFTFVVMTDREDLDDQIWRTFVGCGMANPNTTPRVGSGRDLKAALQENHGFVFSLIHKFNQPVDEKHPYSERDDIIVISDEAHRTQAGKFARNMRLALPHASFIGFTGTPLVKHDHLTRRIFGGYISRYDFKRAEEDGSTVKLVYENRGEKLGIAKLDLNDRIAEKIEQAGLDADQEALLEKLLGQDYEVITADDRLDKLAADFVEHCSARWECGKSMLVCIDKITCARMFQRIKARWDARLAELQALIPLKEAELAATADVDEREKQEKALKKLRGQAAWMQSTIIEIIISEAQNEVRDFAKWGFDIIPHRVVMKNGFETSNGERLNVEDAFKNDQHPFRVAIVCAMWLTGFDVECLQTLYIDKPLKAHTLMQAIARANRIYPGIRHDNIEAIYAKLNEHRDTADVTEVLKKIHKIVNEAIRAQAPGEDQAEGLTLDLSQIDFEKLRDEFRKKVKRKHAVLRDIRDLVEKKLAEMLARNPSRMDYYKKYQMIVADYNREKDRATVEETFAKVAKLVAEMDEELQRHVREGLSEEELTLFDLLLKENITKAAREKLKQASKGLLASLKEHLAAMPTWTKNTATQADVQMFILDNLYASLPRPPFTDDEAVALANKLYGFVFQESERGQFMAA